MSVAIPSEGGSSVISEESISSESRSSKEVSQDTANTKMVGKSETYEAEHSSKVLEENRSVESSASVQSSVSVTQSVTQSSSLSSSKTDNEVTDTYGKPQTLSEQLSQIKESEKKILNSLTNHTSDNTTSAYLKDVDVAGSPDLAKYDDEVQNDFGHVDPYKAVSGDSFLSSPGMVKDVMGQSAHYDNHSDIKDEGIKSSLKEIISDLDSYAQQRELCAELKGLSPEDDETVSTRKNISLEKLFTPAEDAVEIKPQSAKKMFASSAFYAKGFHPTVEDQVELARKISSSLSDSSNLSSKGQSMYVNRKKRSVKWVHEAQGIQLNGDPNCNGHDASKSVLKLVMNPYGQVQDIDSLKKQGFQFESALSPDICAGIVKDLNSPNGKGAELFAKRRKRSEKWVVGSDALTTSKNGLDSKDIVPTPIMTLPSLGDGSPAPGYLPETTQRIQHKEKLDEIQERFIRPKVKLIKSPWEAALETGNVDSAFEDLPAPSWPRSGAGGFVAPAVQQYEHALADNTLDTWKNDNVADMYSGGGGDVGAGAAQHAAYNSSSINRIVDSLQRGTASNVDLYKPKTPQAWSAGAQFGSKQYKPAQSPTVNYQLPLAPSPAFKAEPPAGVVYVPAEEAPKENIPPHEQQQKLLLQPLSTKGPSPCFLQGLNNAQNYNTAPRGWTQKQTVYKPVTFANKKTLSYTDF